MEDKDYPQICVRWDPDNLEAYEAMFHKVHFEQAIAVLEDLRNRMIQQVKLGQTEHPELEVTPVPGGEDDVLN